MSLFLDWFSHTKLLEKDIQKELVLIESVLDGIESAETILKDPADRKKKFERIFLAKRGAISDALKLEQNIEQKLQDYIEGNKTRNLAGILILQNLLRDLQNDKLWQDLKRLWAEEYDLLETDNVQGLQVNLLEQKRIAQILRAITQLEFNETHMHLDTSASPVVHWQYLKKLWAKALQEELPDDKNVIKLYDKYASETGRPDPADVRKLKIIMANYLNRKWNEARAFIEFEKLLIMQDVGCFHEFDKKAWLLNVIELAASRASATMQQNYFFAILDSVAQHNLEHNITHIEIRYPAAYTEGLEFWASTTRDVEKKYRNRITIRFIEFITGNNDPRVFFDAYARASAWVKKYFVAVDLTAKAFTGEIMKYAKQSPLPLCVHAGEFFSQKDFPQRTKLENVEAALKQVQNCVESPNMHRIGHANILGLDIKGYLQGFNSQKVQQLCNLQQELLNSIKRKGIVIEANPTSNILIRGTRYEEHPIQTFQENSIPFAISTDDRTTFDTTLKKEFYRIASVMRWKAREIQLVAKMQKEALLK